MFEKDTPESPLFGVYADIWLRDHARLACKPSTIDGYESVLRLHLRPRFSSHRMDGIKRSDVKGLIADLIEKQLTRKTVRNAISILRSMFNYAIEEGDVELNPAANLGRFTRAAKTSEVKGIALTKTEVKKFLDAAKRLFPTYYPLFLLAVRAGLRRGELVAFQWGDIEFGKDEQDRNRFILVQHNYVRREHTTTKSKKCRRVDMSRELRQVLIALRNERLLAKGSKSVDAIAKEQVFSSPDGSILDPDNLPPHLPGLA